MARGDEPNISINGRRLSVGQAMTMRVALANFYTEVHDPRYTLGEDEHGIAMRDGYRARSTEVLRLMALNQE